MNLGNNSRVWFYYAGEQQVGPLPLSEIKKAVHDGIILEDDYVYREGFHDWKPLREVPELSGNEPIPRKPALPKDSKPGASVQAAARLGQGKANSGAAAPRGKDRRVQPRVGIRELVVAHNDTHIATGSLTDISVSGVFFKTMESCFSINDELKITLKEGKGLGKPLHLRGTVVRQSKENDKLMGYGLELKNLDEKTRSNIIEYVKRHQAF